jgi:hypothetical protein
MASINASTSGAGGLISTADATGNLSLQSGGTTVVALTSAGAAVTGTLSASGVITSASGIVPGYQYYVLNSGNTGTQATTAQSVLGVGVTLAASTQYEFQASFIFQKTAGTTSHTFGIGFGGTATLNNIQYVGFTGPAATTQPANATTMGSPLVFITNSASSITTTYSAISTASSLICIVMQGTISINAGGTFIPQYTLSAAPGGAYTTQVGSYIKIAPLGASGSNISIGSWA